MHVTRLRIQEHVLIKQVLHLLDRAHDGINEGSCGGQAVTGDCLSMAGTR